MQTLITNGDSWVYGSEIVDPKISAMYPSHIHPGTYETKKENDPYRYPRIWPTKLANLLGLSNINLAYPADDNESIYERTIDFITTNYIKLNKNLNDLLVIVGWSSPERSRYWYKDGKISQRVIIWPSINLFSTPAQEDIWKNYVAYQWNKENYIPKFVNQVYNLQLFFEYFNIKYLMFNAFYQGNGSGCDQPLTWDINIKQELLKLEQATYPYWVDGEIKLKYYSYQDIWSLVDPIKYYCKDQKYNSCRSYISGRLVNPLSGFHPSEESHTLWAEHLCSYLQTNKII